MVLNFGFVRGLARRVITPSRFTDYSVDGLCFKDDFVPEPNVKLCATLGLVRSPIVP